MLLARFRHPLYGAGVFALLAATLANYLLRELGHDEGMYLGASYLAVDHDLYRELGYFQAPFLPLLLSRVYAWLDVSHFLLGGRVVAFLHHALTLGLLAAIAWHYTRSELVTFLFTTWLGLNGFLYGAGYSIDNTTFASTYALAGFYGLLRAHAARWESPGLVAASGALVAIAPGFKLNYAPLCAGFAVLVAMFSPRRTAAAFVLGCSAGLAPLVYVALTRFETFWFDNVTWHRSLLTRNVADLGAGTMLAGFARDALYYLVRVSWLGTIVVLSVLVLVLLRWERKSFWTFDRSLLTCLVAISLATIVGLGAVRFWYLQPVAILIALFVPSAYPQLSAAARVAVRWLLALSVAVSAVMQFPSLRQAPDALDTEHWIPLRYTDTGRRVARLTRHRRLESVAAIGNPAIVYGVEGGLPLAPSAATGAFVRVSSPLLAGLSRTEDRIATLDGLEQSGSDMVIATVDYVLPRAEVTPGDWCRPVRPESPFGQLFDRLCASGFRWVMVGDGPARAVVFYR